MNQSKETKYFSDHSYRILIIDGSGSGKANLLLNLIKHQRPHACKIYLFFKDPFESKYHLLINGRERIEIKNLKNRKVFIDYSQTIDDFYANLVGYNPTKKINVLTVFNNMIADMEANKKLKPISC